jgi:hypothetical protein
MKRLIITTALAVASGCGAEPGLFAVDVPRASQGSALDDADAADARPDAPVAEVVVDGADTAAPPARCEGGLAGASWRDALPAPAPAAFPSTLSPSSGLPEGTCADATRVTDPAQAEQLVAATTHASGRWYFEVGVEAFEQGGSNVGVFAAPASGPWDRAYFTDGVPAAGLSPAGPGVVGVAVDLDAAAVGFYVDGALASEAPLLVLPGVGAFRAGASSMPGNALRLNLGADPFAHAPPPGFLAWAAGPAGLLGPCAADADAPAPAAAIDVLCEGDVPCGDGTTFDAASAAPTDLVVLGLYEAGSESSWAWGADAAGDTTPVEVGPGRRGAVVVDLERAGPVALVLSAYEPTDWALRLGPAAQLVSVRVLGMHVQTVSGVPAGVPVEVRSICTGGDGGNCPGTTGAQFPIAAHRWPLDLGGGDTQGFVAHAEAELCLPLADFAGAYSARRFVVR